MGSMAIYLGNSTLGEVEDRNTIRTVGHRVQVDINAQSPETAVWNPVRVGASVMDVCVTCEVLSVV